MAAPSQRFVLGVLGDFGGRRRDIQERRFVGIDRDNFDAAIAKLGVMVELPRTIAFATLDDFHPDRLVERVPRLAALLTARSKPPEAARTEARDTRAEAREVQGILDRILGEIGISPASGRRPSDPALERLVREITEPHVDRTDYATRARWQEGVDRLLSEEMRAVLHHPRFQAVEAAWRGLYALVKDTETGPELAIRVLDLPQTELAAHLAQAGVPEESRFASLLCEEAETPGGTPYAAFVADYAFGPDDKDLATLDAIARVAARAGAPFIAGVRPGLLGLTDFSELGEPEVRRRLEGAPGWQRFRRSPAAGQVALCLPRLLLRLPYGPRSEPVQAFTFDEGLTTQDHARYLWGNAALAFGRVLTRAFERDAWDLVPGADPWLRGLPLHVYREDGEPRAVPCAEVLMTEATIARVAAEGLMPLAAVRDRDEACFCAVQTVGGGRLAVGGPR
jgi:type VI secretion system ImpC/EvpB family protein